MKKPRASFILAVLMIVGAMLFGWQAFAENNRHAQQTAADNAAVDHIQNLRPQAEHEQMDFAALHAQNPDIAAWLTVPGTRIDYPVLQGVDNEFYLYRDMHRNRNFNGSLFMDFRNRSDFSDFHTIIYGHNMLSERKFGQLIHFQQQAFFDQWQTVVLYTPGQRHELEIFAVAVVDSRHELYRVSGFVGQPQQQEHLELLQRTAMHSRSIEVAADDRIVMLSTCSFEFANARTIVVARLAAD